MKLIINDLRFEIEVEAGFETVQLELTWGEESGWGWGGGPEDGELSLLGGLGDNATGRLGIGNGGGTGRGLSASEMSGKVAADERLLVASVEGVDEGVQTLATGAWGNIVGSENTGDLWGELGSLLVEGKVAVGGVVWVDEGVGVGVNWSLVNDWSWGWTWGGLLWDELLLLLPWGNLLWPWSWLGLDEFFFGFLGDESSSVDAGGWNVSAFQDSESFLASGVLHGVGLTIFANVGVLTDSVASVVGLLPEDDLVLGGEGGSGTTVTGVESLFPQDLGIPLVDDLTNTSRDGAGKDNQAKHFVG